MFWDPFNPLNWFLYICIVIATVKLLNKPGNPPIKVATVEKPKEMIDFTPRELAKHNGTQKTIYIAIKGKVFDVSHRSEFYGPGSAYENFAGRDASRGLATNSFDAAVLTPLDQSIDTLDDLDDEAKRSLDDWFNFFTGKYNIVGTLNNPALLQHD